MMKALQLVQRPTTAIVRRCLATQTAATTTAPAKQQQSDVKPSILDRLGERYIPAQAGKRWGYIPADFKEFPERDTKNYPHPNELEFPSQVRLGAIPNSWFNFFYEKTGETGGYLFMGGLAVFLLQKELIVVESHGLAATARFLTLMYFLNLFAGPAVGRYNEQLFEDNAYNRRHAWKEKMLSGYKDSIASEEALQQAYQVLQDSLFVAKRENVQLQLEAGYRERLNEVYNTVRRQIEFLVEYEATRRRFEQKHMADWIMDQVHKSLTPAMEAATLKQCVLDLKTLAAKAV
jgi:F-type H+-transporting ATPase subunit b